MAPSYRCASVHCGDGGGRCSRQRARARPGLTRREAVREVLNPENLQSHLTYGALRRVELRGPCWPDNLIFHTGSALQQTAVPLFHSMPRGQLVSVLGRTPSLLHDDAHCFTAGLSSTNSAFKSLLGTATKWNGAVNAWMVSAPGGGEVCLTKILRVLPAISTRTISIV